MRSYSGGLALNRPALTSSIILAVIMQGVDTTIANVALPHIQGSLSASQDQVAWVLTSYIVAAAITMPLSGWLAGRFGIKSCSSSRSAGSPSPRRLCGSADEPDAACLLPPYRGCAAPASCHWRSRCCSRSTRPQRHGQAMAVFGTGSMVGPIMGPTLGGWLTDQYNWRWVFYINLPVGLLATLGILIFMRETAPRPSRAFRLLRLRRVEPRDRRVADDARPRRAERLVFLERDLDRDSDLRASASTC